MLFTETQRFRQWWLILLLGAIFAHLLFGAYQQLFNNIPMGDHPVSNTGMIGLVLFICVIFALFFIIKLETRITTNAIFFRFYPFQIKFRKITKDEINHLDLVQFRPIRDFGGWGIRMGSEVDWAYTIAGNKGLKVFNNSGKVILIGTQKSDELQRALAEFQK
jgi:hypothetical protein